MNFTEVEAQYRSLKAQHAAGTLSEADFKAQLQDLMIDDDQGHWWIIGYETGQWYVHDGEQWAPGEPPRPAPVAPPPAPTPEVPPPQVKAEPAEPISQRLPEKEPRPSSTPQRDRGQPWLWVVVGIAGVVLLVLLVQAIGRIDARPTPIPVPAGQEAPPAEPVKTSEATKLPEPTWIPEPTKASAPQAASAGIVTRLVAPGCDYGGEILAIEALDELTVRFTLCYPDVAFPAKVALPPFGIHPAEHLVATGGTGKLLEAPIGTGPYRLTEWRPNEFVRMEANPDYWGKPATIPRLEFHWLDDWDRRLGYLETGDVDGIDNPSPQAYAAIQGNADLRLYRRPGLNTGYLGISNLAKPFDDVRVRQAVALAIDREWLVKQVYPPGTILATHFTPCEILNGCQGEPWHDFDPDKARMLLAEAGYPGGFETELFYRDSPRSYLPDPMGTARYIADMLEKYLSLRVRLTATNMDSEAFRKASWGGEFPLYLSGWDVDYPDPVNFLSPYWSEFGAPRLEDGFPEIWAILKEATLTASPVVRAELYARANDLITREAPLVPLVHVGSATAFRADVLGAHSSPLYLEQFAVMGLQQGSTLVWKQATAPKSLYCADESDVDTWRACAQITESLLGFQVGSAEVMPALAHRYEPNETLTTWTFYLRPHVKFHDGSTLDAGDVVISWAVMWDAANPLHKGRTGAFDYFLWMFDAFLNAEK